MKPTAFFINTSRGGTYNESDLARALAERKIAGAGIDVFLEEPPPTDHPLMAFDNVILTPHNAGSTREVPRQCCDLRLGPMDRHLRWQGAAAADQQGGVAEVFRALSEDPRLQARAAAGGVIEVRPDHDLLRTSLWVAQSFFCT